MDVKRLFGVVIMAALLFPRAIYAQDGNNPPANGGVTIHVVQRDENLYRIAMRYGTTVEAIAEANGIADPRYIAVGQRLLIPNAQSNAPGAVIIHSVKPGDTLWSLAFTYHTTPDQLAVANHLTNPATLFAGQELTINQGADEPDQNIPGAIHSVEPGENLLRIALKYGVTSNLLARVNDMPIPSPVFAGQRLWIPGDGDETSIADLPAPLTAFTLSPIPAIQGKTISIHVRTTGPATLTGTFMGYPVQFVTQDANQHYAIFGIHAFAAAGIYPMALTISGADGIQTAYAVRVRVDEGGYGAENISLDTTQQDLLTPQVTEPEWQRVATVMSSFTAQRYFDGLMGLPSTGAITSQFGTRRIYNGGTLDTFHSGTDFGGGPGSPILAPAPG
jgi:LysM repeat protein